MVDGNRAYPVDLVVVHHAVSDFMVNWSDLQVQDWFSNVGKARGYNNGGINPNHEHPGRPGQLTYSQAHYCLHEYTADGNKYGWRLTLLIKRPMDNVAWHAGNWPVNQRSIGIEVAGNYLNKQLPDKALMLVADTFRAHDVAIGGKLDIGFHNQFYATQCPGRIAENYNKMIDMFNNPKKWNDTLWPAPVAPTWKPMDTPRKMRTKALTQVTNLDNNSKAGEIAPGVDTDFVEKKDQNGTQYLRSRWSMDNKKNWGVDIKSLIEVPTETITKKTITRTESIAFKTVEQNDDSLAKGQTRVIREGSAGTLSIQIEQVHTNGVLTSEKEIGRKVSVAPIDKVVSVGTKESYPGWFVEFWLKLIDSIKSILGK